MRKSLIAAALCLSCLGSAQAYENSGRSTTIWNAMENQVAVLKGPSHRLGENYVVVHPTKKWSGLGRYQVVMPRDALRPRAKGGWYTDITIDEFPYLPPEVPQYFQPSGT